jgi:energy-coupling factor transporter ATP-binding protein EcfA2
LIAPLHRSFAPHTTNFPCLALSIRQNAMAEQRVVFILGRTGDGKSALAKALALVLGVQLSPFSDSDEGQSHTHDPVSCAADDLLIVDNPGLLDSNGGARDDENIRKIVDAARSHGHIHAFILVLNEQADRFDSAMQNVVRVLADSFGPGALARMGIVFSKSYPRPDAALARRRADAIRADLAQRNGVPAESFPLPAYQYDAYPDDLVRMGSPPEFIADKKEAARQALGDVVRWVRGQTPLSTRGFKYGEYDHSKREREALEKAARAGEEAAEARRAEQHAVARAEAAEERAAQAAAAGFHMAFNFGGGGGGESNPGLTLGGRSAGPRVAAPGGSSGGRSFDSAFAQAARDLGPGREFVWQGNRYSTNRGDGHDMRPR